MNEFDDIEEVESSPKRRVRLRRNNNPNSNNNDISQIHDNNHDHIHEHHHHHHHHFQENQISQRNTRRKRVIFIRNFGKIAKLLMTLFLLSSFVLFLSFLANLILSIKGIFTPKIFMPSIIIFLTTFLFAGGILGTYVSPPPGHRNNLRQGDILLMRSLTPIVMSIISFVFLIFSLDNIKYLKESIKRSQNICESEKGLSMEEIYNKFNTTFYELEQLKYNLILTFNKNIVCFPKGKCIKLINEENSYICNNDEFIKMYNISDSKCNKIKFNEKNLYQIEKNKITNLFFDNCNEINDKGLAIIEMFICQSKNNLEKIKLISGWDENDKINIENYFNNKLDNMIKQMEKIKKNMRVYEDSEYSYDLECYDSIDYKICYFMINSYTYIYYIISFAWLFLGIWGISQLIKFINNDEIDSNISSEEINEINGKENEEDNKLIEVQEVKNIDKYMESQNPAQD